MPPRPPLVQYGSSDEDESDGEGRHAPAVSPQQRPNNSLAATAVAAATAATAPGPTASHQRRPAVHTSLGVPRTVPLKGDWLGHVYLPLNAESEVSSVLRTAYRVLQSHVAIPKGAPTHHSDADTESRGIAQSVAWVNDPHLSLTRPILLRQHEGGALVDVVRTAVDAYREQQPQSRLMLAFAAFATLRSEDGTRIYWVAEVGLGWEQLRQLASCLDAPLQARLQQRPYYGEARFHVSFASAALCGPEEAASDAAAVAADDDKRRAASVDADAQPPVSLASVEAATTALEICLGKTLRACAVTPATQLAIAFGHRRTFVEL